MDARRRCMLLLPVLLLGGLSWAEAELVAVYSVQRHGARNVLPKSSTLKESDSYGGPTLLPAGRKQCYEAGEWELLLSHASAYLCPSQGLAYEVCAGQAFRKRYIDPATCGDTCLTPSGGGGGYGLVSAPNVSYSNYNTMCNSSALHRTLLSGQSFLLGVFGGVSQGQPSYLSYPVSCLPLYARR